MAGGRNLRGVEIRTDGVNQVVISVFTPDIVSQSRKLISSKDQSRRIVMWSTVSPLLSFSSLSLSRRSTYYCFVEMQGPTKPCC